jgi:hypothetical protein
VLPKIQRELDPLDFEIVERTFESAWSALKETGFRADVDSDEERPRVGSLGEPQ